MKYRILVLLTIVIFGCENNSFDSDKRQLAAKDAIREKLGNIHAFDIKDFKEDTLNGPESSAFKNVIRYNLHVVYKDSTEAMQDKEASVIFTPDGKSVISSQINN